MEYRHPGNCGLMVSELALGTMIFGEPDGRATPPAEAMRQAHRYLLRCGVRKGLHLLAADENPPQ